jgi:hypothetical protein
LPYSTNEFVIHLDTCGGFNTTIVLFYYTCIAAGIRCHAALFGISTQVEHLKATTHTNISKISTPMYYMVKTLKEGNNPWTPTKCDHLRQYINAKGK